MAMICFYIFTVTISYLLTVNICLYVLSSIKQFTPGVIQQERVLVSIRLRPVKTVRFLFCFVFLFCSCDWKPNVCLTQCRINMASVWLSLLLNWHYTTCLDIPLDLYRWQSASARHRKRIQYFGSIVLLCCLWPRPQQYGERGKTCEGFLWLPE